MSADRTLPATPRRREQAHRRGLIPTSDGLAWIASAMVLTACLPMWLRSISSTVSEQLGRLPSDLADPQSPLAASASQIAWQLAWPTMMLLTATTATGLGVRLLIDRPRMVLNRLAACDRLNPLHGLRRMASRETARQVLVGLLATVIFAIALRWSFADLTIRLRDATLDPRDEGRRLFWLAWQGLWGVMLSAAAVAALQHLLRWRASERRLRMTPEEMREEQRLVEANARVRLPTRGAPEEPGSGIRRQATPP